MTLNKRMIGRAFVVGLILDVAIVWLFLRFNQPDAKWSDWVAPIGVLWAGGLLYGTRKWLRTVLTLWTARNDLAEQLRRAYVQGEIPPPPGYDMDPEHYLCSVADNEDIDFPVRQSASFAYAYLINAAQTQGLTFSFFIHDAAQTALNKLR